MGGWLPGRPPELALALGPAPSAARRAANEEDRDFDGDFEARWAPLSPGARRRRRRTRDLRGGGGADPAAQAPASTSTSTSTAAPPPPPNQRREDPPASLQRMEAIAQGVEASQGELDRLRAELGGLAADTSGESYARYRRDRDSRDALLRHLAEVVADAVDRRDHAAADLDDLLQASARRRGRRGPAGALRGAGGALLLAGLATAAAAALRRPPVRQRLRQQARRAGRRALGLACALARALDERRHALLRALGPEAALLTPGPSRAGSRAGSREGSPPSTPTRAQTEAAEAPAEKQRAALTLAPKLGKLGQSPPSPAAATGPHPRYEQTPKAFLCPITYELMKNPVLIADGHSYELSAIVQWLKDHDTSPITNLPLQHKSVIPNHSLRGAIQDYTSTLKARAPAKPPLPAASRAAQ